MDPIRQVPLEIWPHSLMVVDLRSVPATRSTAISVNTSVPMSFAEDTVFIVKDNLNLTRRSHLESGRHNVSSGVNDNTGTDVLARHC